MRTVLALDDAGEVIWAIVHSHLRSPARPSPTDVSRAFYPDALFVLISLGVGGVDAEPGREDVRAWRIVDGRVHEVRLDIT